ncbi:hypothetical protein LXA43DRAFT_516947 [Ganoderma leucocontextum]|nr:hypothetical protein LXA43DRAFT_516947 [Ganoderma leucocontextum]
MSTTFLNLPVELRRMIKDWVDPSDLRTHVWLYLTHSSCSALYDDRTDPEGFWRRLCWNCGLGRLPDEEAELSDDEFEWRSIAIECVRRDGFCTLPHCGESLLEYNRARMRENAAYVEVCTPLRVREDYREDGGKATFDVHPALCHVDFRASSENHHYEPHPVENDAHFRWHCNAATKNETPVDVKKRAYVGDHPLAARSFATATPVSNMMLFSFVQMGSTKDLDFDRPVTVFDVLSAIHQDLDGELSVHDVHSYLAHGSTPHAKCVAQAKWGVEEAFANLQNGREVLTLCPIKGMKVDELTDYGAAVFIDLY